MRPEQVLARAAEVADDVRARGHRLFLAQADVLTAYCVDEVAAPRWIAQFFAGHLGESEARRPDATVVSTGDPELFSALRELAPGTGDDPAEMPLTDAVTVVRRRAGKVTPPEDVYLLLLPEDRTIVLVTSGNPEVCREEGMQTLRALSKWLLIERGWIPMHSACAAKDGRTICVSGPKASGKTSTLLNLLARNGCDLVAVDKFLVRDGGGQLDVCGIPGKIGIRVGSAVVQPAVLDWLSTTTTPFFPHMSRDEVEQIAATSSPAQLRTRSEKIHLTPAELSGLFGGSVTPSAPLGLLLVPVFELGIERARTVRIEPAQAVDVLRDSRTGLLSKGEGFLRHFFDLDDAVLEARLAALLAEHLPAVEAHELHQDHRTNEQAAELVAGLLS